MFACKTPQILSGFNKNFVFSRRISIKSQKSVQRLPSQYKHVFTLCLNGFRGTSLHAVAFLNSENFGPNLTRFSCAPLSLLSPEFMRKRHFCHRRINNRQTIKGTVTRNFTLCLYFLTFGLFVLGLYRMIKKSLCT